MTLEFDLYWSFRSPYCYLIADRMVELVERHDIACRLRPVYPTAVKNPAFFEQINPLWFRYFALDVKRSADFAGLPIRWPVPDPVAVEADSQRPAADQARIRLLTRLGVAAERAGGGLAFARHLGTRLWSGEIDGWDAPHHLEAAANEAGLSYRTLVDDIERNTAAIDGRIEANEQDQKTAGHWGVPLMVFDGEPFFGQDRFEMFLWRLRQRGLADRCS